MAIDNLLSHGTYEEKNKQNFLPAVSPSANEYLEQLSLQRNLDNPADKRLRRPRTSTSSFRILLCTKGVIADEVFTKIVIGSHLLILDDYGTSAASKVLRIAYTIAETTRILSTLSVTLLPVLNCMARNTCDACDMRTLTKNLHSSFLFLERIPNFLSRQWSIHYEEGLRLRTKFQ